MKLPEQRIWFGSEEPIFNVLPANVLSNFRNPRSENALLWNTVYKLAQPTLNLRSVLAIKPIWGTRGHFEEPEDELLPYFWGFSVQGERLAGLEATLDAIDGSGPRTELDLVLLGEKHLIVVEAKHTSGFGRCTRYQQGRCPEIHPEQAVESSCRYWDVSEAKFERAIRIATRPELGTEAPACSRHYQLSRTLLIGEKLASAHGRIFSLWAFVSGKVWRSLELDWLDFTGRLRDSNVWRRARVVSWSGLSEISG
jgi:hypothetical protein